MFLTRNCNFGVILNLILAASFFFPEILCKNVDIEVPSDIAAMSNFIKEFHKKLQDESYPQIKHEVNEKDFPSIIESIPFYTIKNEYSSERNFSSLVKCSQNQFGTQSVEVLNSTRLSTLLASEANITSRLVEGQCLAVLFFSPTCPFSCLAAPHFNALPRAFPWLKVVAINAIHHQAFNTQFGIAGVPTFMLFHNGKAAAKFNDTQNNLEQYVRFIMRITGFMPESKMFVRSADFGGPVPTILVKETDYILGLAWAVIILTILFGITQLDRYQEFIESVIAVWRESNHDHIE